MRCEISIVLLFAFEQYDLTLAKEHLVAGLTNYARTKKEPMTCKTLLAEKHLSIIISRIAARTLGKENRAHANLT